MADKFFTATDVTNEYILQAKPNMGIFEYDIDYDKSLHLQEINIGIWLFENLGGDIRLLKEINEDKKKTPDYLWRNRLWELKTLTTEKAANSAVRYALKQIHDNPGGIILDFMDDMINWEHLVWIIDSRMRRCAFESVDIIVICMGKLQMVRRYKKK